MTTRKCLKEKKKLKILSSRERWRPLSSEGKREYREEIITEQLRSCILDPATGMQLSIKENPNKILDEAIDELFVVARRKYESFKLNAAAQTYCGILRLLKGVDDDERYQLAEDQIKTLEKKMGMLEGEFNCLPKEQKIDELNLYEELSGILNKSLKPILVGLLIALFKLMIILFRGSKPLFAMKMVNGMSVP